MNKEVKSITTTDVQRIVDIAIKNNNVKYDKKFREYEMKLRNLDARIKRIESKGLFKK